MTRSPGTPGIDGVASDLFAFIRELRALGVIEYQGANPYDTSMLVTLRLGDLPWAPPAVDPEPPAKVDEQRDPIDALNARLFRDPMPTPKVTDGA
jgi:hypothetical protein